MQQLFTKSRIQLQNMIDDVTSFTQNVYKQSGNLYTPASPWGQVILTLTKLGQLMIYYIEDSITELFINYATRPGSIAGDARLAGHNATRAIAAMGDLFLISNGTVPQIQGNYIIIPNFTRIKCKDNNLTYLAVLGQDEIKIDITQGIRRIYLKVIQGTIESQQFTGTGYPLQSYSVNIPPSKQVDNFFANVFVNGSKWTKYDSFYDMPNGANAVMVKTGITGGIDIYFGTNNLGVPPPQGSTILVEYLITEGFNGNIIDTTGVSWEFQDSGYDIQGNEVDLNSLYTVGIATPISFGSAAEPTYLTRLLAPGTSRSYVLAQTGNYINFFQKMQMFSHIDAYTKYNIYDPYVDNIMYLVLVPDISKRFRSGENYFTVPIDRFLLDAIEKYKIQVLLEESGQKLLGTIINFVDPQFKRYAINIFINVWDTYNQDLIKEKIVSQISDYLTQFTRLDFLPQSDLVTIVEGIDGVNSVNVEFISEDVETQIYNLMFDFSILDTDVISEQDKLDIWNQMIAISINGDINSLSIEQKLPIIFANGGFQQFVLSNIDENGDIVLGQNERPLIRGGWKDRFGNFYADIVDNNKTTAINIKVLRVNSKNINSQLQNLNINTLK